ncbi:MAG: hypothetical protein ACOC1O_02195 [bacterium]
MKTTKQIKEELEKEIEEYNKEFENKKDKMGVRDLELYEADVTFHDYIPEFHRIRLGQIIKEERLQQHNKTLKARNQEIKKEINKELKYWQTAYPEQEELLRKFASKIKLEIDLLGERE